MTSEAMSQEYNISLDLACLSFRSRLEGQLVCNQMAPMDRKKLGRHRAHTPDIVKAAGQQQIETEH